MHSDLVEAARLLNIKLPALEKAAKLSHGDIANFKEELLEVFPYQSEDGTDPKNVDVALLGAHARGEATQGSDCDYFILQSGASPEISQGLIAAMDKVLDQSHLRGPGGQGVFGNIVIAANLYECIGLELDTNLNMTRRVLLLTESTSVYSEETRQTVIDNVLSRYCADYLPPYRDKGSPAKVPRFLLNDLVRYWRTIAVDFGAKRWRTLRSDSYLRLAKLMTTRKLLFAGPLATLLLAPDRVEDNEGLQGYLKEWLDKPPLAQLASTEGQLSGSAKGALADILVEYDKFVGILSDREKRKLFEKPNAPGFKRLSDDSYGIGNTIQKSLEAIFFDDPLFKDKFRKYAAF